MFGVLYPMTPREYALTFVCPMSSPKMTRMFGFFAVACAAAGSATNSARTAAAATLIRDPPWKAKIEFLPRRLTRLVCSTTLAPLPLRSLVVVVANPETLPLQRGVTEMISRDRLLARAVIVFSLCAACRRPSWAADSTDKSMPGELVEVTATRLPEDPIVVPASVQIVS